MRGVYVLKLSSEEVSCLANFQIILSITDHSEPAIVAEIPDHK